VRGIPRAYGYERPALSQALRVPATRLHEIVKERRSITTLYPFALSLSKGAAGALFRHGRTVLAEFATEL